MNDDLIKFGAVIIGALLAALSAFLLYTLKKKDDELNLIKGKISDENDFVATGHFN